jgi:hypothetical protein
MSANQTKSFGQRIIEISELPKKKYFFWTSFVGAFPTFVFFYIISPLLQTKINDFQYDTMAFLISCLISTLIVTFFVSCSLDYMKYSPKVYGTITNRTYTSLAKNRFVQGIFDLFTNSAEKKLNPIWNERGLTIDQHAEQLAGHENRLEKLEISNKTNDQLIKKIQEYEEMILPHIARSNRNTFDNNFRISQLEKEVKKIIEKIENNQITSPISVTEFAIITAKLLEIKEEIRKLKGD